MGNFEVGYINIGVGCVVVMDLGQIDLLIEDGSFVKIDVLVVFIVKFKEIGGCVYILGVVLDGGVYGYIVYIIVVVNVIYVVGVFVVLYVIIDGCDVVLKFVDIYMVDLIVVLLKGVIIVIVMGCYFVMDCDNCWEWVLIVYNVMINGIGLIVENVVQVIEVVYVDGVIDEFILVIVLQGYDGVVEGDGLFCLNFCVDCVWEILVVIGDLNFDGFDCGDLFVFVVCLGMVEYLVNYNGWFEIVFFKCVIENIFGVWVVKYGLI